MGQNARTLREVMTQPVNTAPPETPVRKVAQRMAIARIGCILIVDQETGLLIGVFTERDLLRMFTTTLEPPFDEPVAEYMSRYPLSYEADAPIEEARDFMRDNMIRHLPLTEQGRLVGLVSIRDIAIA